MTRRLLITITLLCATPARADNKAAADVAFEEGRALAQTGRFKEACTSFEKSQKLEPAVGTLLNLADCHVRVGRIASAWSEFLDAAERARQAGQEARQKEAVRRAAELEPRLIRLQILVPPGGEVTSVFRRDTDVTRAVGVATPVDPGSYLIIVRWRSGETTRRVVDVKGEGRTVSVTVPLPLPLPRPAAELQPEPVLLVTEPDEPARAGLGTHRTLALGAGGLGLASLGTALYFGHSARGKRDDARAFCDDENLCTQEGFALTRSAQQRARVANIFGAAAIVGLAGGALLWFTAPDDAESGVGLSPDVSSESAGLVLHGWF